MHSSWGLSWRSREARCAPRAVGEIRRGSFARGPWYSRGCEGARTYSYERRAGVTYAIDTAKEAVHVVQGS